MSAPIRKTTHEAVDELSVGRRGVESRILHNGLILNDCRDVDHYKVMEITGLDDVDIRDVREDNPDRDGETAYTAFGGGRTITIRGYIQAGNFSKLRQMETNLLRAFNNLEESSLDFLYLDDINNFDDTTKMVDWTSEGSSSYSVSDDHLNATLISSEIKFYYNLREYKDTQFTIKIDNIDHSDDSEVAAIIKRISSDTHLDVSWDKSAQELKVIKYVSGTPTTLKTIDISELTLATTLYIRGSVIGDIVWAEAWSVEPESISYPYYDSELLIFDTHELTGSDATTFGENVLGEAGFRFSTDNLNQNIDYVEVQSANPGDLRVVGRKIGKIEFSEAQSTSRVRRDFLITFRSSNGLLESRVENKLRFNLTSIQTLSFPGGHLTFPADGSGLILGEELATIENVGARNIPIRVIFNVSTSDCGLGNINSNEFVLFNPTVLKWELDTKERNVISNADGSNLYSTFGNIHDWIRLVPGQNFLTWGVNVTISEVMLFYRNSY